MDFFCKMTELLLWDYDLYDTMWKLRFIVFLKIERNY